MFGKKPKMTADDVLEMLKGMSAEDVAKIRDSLKGDGETEMQIEKAEEDIAEKGKSSEQTEKDRIDESVAMQEKDNGDEDSQNAKDRVDEAEGMMKKEAEEEAEENAEGKTENDVEGDGEDFEQKVMDLLTKIDARVTALEKAEESEEWHGEEVGADSDFADSIAPRMPQSYYEQAKKMRY